MGEPVLSASHSKGKTAYERLIGSVAIEMLEEANDSLPLTIYVTNNTLQNGAMVWRIRLSDNELLQRWEPGEL